MSKITSGLAARQHNTENLRRSYVHRGQVVLTTKSGQ
ncbi:Conserved hypothetical protein [Prochlorococcus marinus str. MIT 9303]|uniref:Uncharacterized protein n=1 Tax=Prochlorococcus marinus (strain MIT 9303) TaxID=59922 RepID=A2CCF6_PROM3|nr:Conserved hypothetical protein [Prochlorococcus marinus str. MIT 9303]